MSPARKPTVGFVGLGSQGGPMARRIAAAGFPLLLWARRAEALAPFADTSAEAAADLDDLGGRCDIVAICVVDDAGVREVFDAVAPAMRPGGRIVIHSTIHPDSCAALADEAEALSLALVDAPVSGGGPGAAAGTLTVMVGGAEADVAAVRPVFETFAGLIAHLGGVGAGQLAKLVNNAQMAANMAIADAGLGAAEALGLDRAAYVELVKASSGRSFGFEVRARLPDVALFGHGAKLLEKDVGLLSAVLADDPSVAALRAAASPFLERIGRLQAGARVQGDKP